MMWKLLLYKEWLKIRWFILIYTVLGVAVLGYLMLDLRHSFAFGGGQSVWSAVLFQNRQFYSLFKFVPLAGGVVLAFSQYLPEVLHKRLKLTFHLPVAENKSLLLMQIFGAWCLLISFGIQFALFYGFNLLYFPVQVVLGIVATIVPWFLAGFSAYFLISLVILEPKWIFRFFYSAMSALFLTTYFESATAAAYVRLNPSLAWITATLIVVILFPAHRFRKGEM